MKNQYDQLNLEYGIPKELKGIDIVVLFSFFFFPTVWARLSLEIDLLVMFQVYQSTDNPTSRNEDSDVENEDAFGYPPEHSVQVI